MPSGGDQQRGRRRSSIASMFSRATAPTVAATEAAVANAVQAQTNAIASALKAELLASIRPVLEASVRRAVVDQVQMILSERAEPRSTSEVSADVVALQPPPASSDEDSKTRLPDRASRNSFKTLELVAKAELVESEITEEVVSPPADAPARCLGETVAQSPAVATSEADGASAPLGRPDPPAAGAPPRSRQPKRSILKQSTARWHSAVSQVSGALKKVCRRSDEGVDPEAEEQRWRKEIGKAFEEELSRSVDDEEEEPDDPTSWLVIHPHAPVRFVWDMSIMVLTIFIAFEVPFRAAFVAAQQDGWDAYDWFVDSAFCVDIVLNFRTGYVSRNGAHVIFSPGRIARRYLRSWFAVDLLSTIPFERILCGVSTCTDDGQSSFSSLSILRVSKATKLLRLLRLTRIIRCMQRWEAITLVFSSNKIRVLKLIAVMTMFAHWVGCLHYLVAVLEGMPLDSWPVRAGLDRQGLAEQYFTSLFNAVSQMLSIGYGIAPPVRIAEVIMVLLSMILGATLYGLFVASLTSFLADSDASARQYSSKLDMLNQYMKHRQLPRELRKRMRSYLELCFPNKRAFNEAEILCSLTLPLRQQVCWHKCAAVLRRMPLASSLEPGLMGAMALALQRVVYVQGDYILREGEVGRDMYFVAAGEVQVVTGPPEAHVEVARLREGAFFGEMALLDTAERHMASVRVSTFLDGFCMSRSAYVALARDYPSVRQYLESIAKMRLAQSLESAGVAPSDEAWRDAELQTVVNTVRAVREADARPRAAPLLTPALLRAKQPS